MQRVLSFEQAPPLSVPLRFFLTAPLFAIAASLLLLWHGPSALASRWSPTTLALTHILTLGFLAMCMIGALLQILPVVAGIVIPHSRPIAAIVHALLTSGTLLLISGFLLSSSAMMKLALPLLFLAFACLLLVGLRGIWSAPDAKEMLIAIRFAVAALAVTIGLGLTAASAFSWPLSLPLAAITNVHAAWGLLGWVGLLVAGVAYQVVPMFQVTPLYPRIVTQWYVKTVFLLLVLWTVAVTFTDFSAIVGNLIAFAFAAFACTTLYLLWHRKRPKPDATTMFWRTSLVSLLGAALLWIAGTMFLDLAQRPSYPLALGILVIVGFAVSAINGMLYKIVPFLVWYHLQQQLAGGCTKAPNVRQILPDSTAEKQFRVHLLALVALIAAAVWPQWLTYVAALCFAGSSIWLWLNLMQATRLYRKISLEAALAPKPSV